MAGFLSPLFILGLSAPPRSIGSLRGEVRLSPLLDGVVTSKPALTGKVTID